MAKSNKNKKNNTNKKNSANNSSLNNTKKNSTSEVKKVKKTENKASEVKKVNKVEKKKTSAAKKPEYNNQEQKGAFKRFCEKYLSGQVFTNGLYATFMIIAVVAIAVVVNILAASLNLKADLTENKMYSLTDETKKFVKGVKDDVIIYYLTSPAGENSQIKELVEKYDALNKHITVELKDPDVYPKFVAQYDETVESVADNSILVLNKSNDKFKYLAYADLVQSEFDYETYSYEVTGIDVEGQLDSAINMVTTDSAIKIGMVTGHGEQEAFGTRISGLLTKINVTTEKVAIGTGDEIPEDCKALVIFAPTADFSKEEVEKIKTFVDAGHGLLVMSGYDYEGHFENFEGLLNYYGVRYADGLIVEKNMSYTINGYAQVLSVTPDTESEITANLARLYTVFPETKPVVALDDISEYLTVTPAFTTSSESYAMTDFEMSINDVNSNNSTKGPFNAAVTITKKVDDKESKIAVFGSSAAFNENMLDLSSFTNPTVMTNTVNWICDADSENTIAVDVKENNEAMITVDDAKVVFWTVALVIVVPIAIIVAGIVVSYKRRHR